MGILCAISTMDHSDDEHQPTVVNIDWTKLVDPKLQTLIGHKQEKEYFSVMHLGGTKVLWHRPEDYEHACGVEISGPIKQAWYQKTGRKPMQWVVDDN